MQSTHFLQQKSPSPGCTCQQHQRFRAAVCIHGSHMPRLRSRPVAAVPGASNGSLQAPKASSVLPSASQQDGQQQQQQWQEDSSNRADQPSTPGLRQGYASLTRFMMTGQPSNFVRGVAGRAGSRLGPVTLLISLLGFALMLMAAVRALLVSEHAHDARLLQCLHPQADPRTALIIFQ